MVWDAGVLDDEWLLQQALKEPSVKLMVQQAQARAQHAEAEAKRCQERCDEVSRSAQSSLRVVARFRPALEGEEECTADWGGLRVPALREADEENEDIVGSGDEDSSRGRRRMARASVASPQVMRASTPPRYRGSSCIRPLDSSRIEVQAMPQPHESSLLGGSLEESWSGVTCARSASPRSRRHTIGAFPGRATSAKGDRGGRGIVKTVSLDRVYPKGASNDQIFESVQADVLRLLQGECACFIAYGAAGSGKTHTFMGLAACVGRCLEEQAQALVSSNIDVTVQMQVVEVYNGQLHDLCTVDEGASAGDELRKLSTSTSSSTTWPLGASSRTFTLSPSMRDFKSLAAEDRRSIYSGLLEMLMQAQGRRKKRSGPRGAFVSRSHLVAKLTVTCSDRMTREITKVGKLCMADLAGADNVTLEPRAFLHAEAHPNAVQKWLLESQGISGSLSSLTDVLVSREQRCTQVPYHSSCLTHLFQDVLGAAEPCRAVVCVTLTAAKEAVNETLRSLQFAARLVAASGKAHGSRRLSSVARVPRAPPDVSQSSIMMPLLDDVVRVEGLKSEAEQLRVGTQLKKAQLEQGLRQLAERERALDEAKRKTELLELEDGHRSELVRVLGGFHKQLENVEHSAEASNWREEICEASRRALSAAVDDAGRHQPIQPGTSFRWDEHRSVAGSLKARLESRPRHVGSVPGLGELSVGSSASTASYRYPIPRWMQDVQVGPTSRLGRRGVRSRGDVARSLSSGPRSQASAQSRALLAPRGQGSSRPSSIMPTVARQASPTSRVSARAASPMSTSHRQQQAGPTPTRRNSPGPRATVTTRPGARGVSAKGGSLQAGAASPPAPRGPSPTLMPQRRAHQSSQESVVRGSSPLHQAPSRSPLKSRSSTAMTSSRASLTTTTVGSSDPLTSSCGPRKEGSLEKGSGSGTSSSMRSLHSSTGGQKRGIHMGVPTPTRSEASRLSSMWPSRCAAKPAGVPKPQTSCVAGRRAGGPSTAGMRAPARGGQSSAPHLLHGSTFTKPLEPDEEFQARRPSWQDAIIDAQPDVYDIASPRHNASMSSGSSSPTPPRCTSAAAPKNLIGIQLQLKLDLSNVVPTLGTVGPLDMASVMSIGPPPEMTARICGLGSHGATASLVA